MNEIVAEIGRRGRVDFATFMELALYHPTAGYYTRSRSHSATGPVGADGDFITAPTAAPLFARTLAHVVEELAGALGQPVTFAELGAGEGLLLAGLLTWLGAGRARSVERVVAVERAAWARERVAERCPPAEVVERLEEAPRPRGPVVLFASELYDALPAHRVTVRRRDGELELAELFVGLGEDGRLRFEVGTPADAGLAEYLAAHGVRLEEGQVAELRPGLEAVHGAHLRWCGKSAVAIVVDYGYPAPQLYNPRARRGGTAVGYRHHGLVEDVLASPGEIDLTAHVNFDDLDRAAVALGFERGGLLPLAGFLALHGALDFLPPGLGSERTPSAREWAELATAKRLLSPGGMGCDLRVLRQGKGAAWLAYGKLSTPPPIEA